MTYLSQTAPEPLRFPFLVPLNEKPPLLPPPCVAMMWECRHSQPNRPGVGGENVVNLVNPGDCLKMSSISAVYPSSWQRHIVTASLLYSSVQHVFLRAPSERERESISIVALSAFGFSLLCLEFHRPPFLFFII